MEIGNFKIRLKGQPRRGQYILFSLKKGNDWYHAKFGYWYQRTLKLTTRAQQKRDDRERRYVQGYRFQATAWKAKPGNQVEGQGRALGIQFYWR